MYAPETGDFPGPARRPRPLPRPEAGWDGYGQHIAACFNVETVQTAATTRLKRAQIGVTRVTATDAVGRSSPLPAERAYAVMLHLRDCADADLLRAGELVASGPFAGGSIAIAHFADEPALDLRAPFDMLLVHIPQIVFDELADDHGAPRIAELSDQDGVSDPVMHHLGRALLPILSGEADTPSLLLDHVAFAMHARLATLFGRAEPRSAPAGGALSPWQARAAKDALAADLSREPALADVARACGVPAGRFVRAFRLTTGMPPHRWLRWFRVERAKDLLLASGLSLSQIVYDCGFADQSHFSRVFAAAAGAPPGVWRRARRG